MAWVGPALKTVGSWIGKAWSAKGAWGTLFRTAVQYGASRLADKILSGKRKSASGPGFTMSQDPAPIDQVIYGKARVSGPVVFYWSHDENNKFANMIIVLSCHEVAEVTSTMWANEERITISGTDVLGRFANRLWVSRQVGTDDQAADARLLTRVASASWIASNGPTWTSNHRLRGRAYVHVEIQENQDLYASGIPNFSFLVKGKKIYDPRTDTTVWSDNPALILRDYLTSTEYGLGALAEQIDDDAVAAAANVCDEVVGLRTAFTRTGTVTEGDRFIQLGDGQATGIYVGINVAGTGIPIGARVDAVDHETDVVTIDVDPTASGTPELSFGTAELRYRCNAVVRTDTEPGAIIDAIEATMAGKCAPVGGVWTMRAGAWEAPTVTLAEDDLRDGLTVQTCDDLADAVNRVQGTYTSEADLFQTVPFPQVFNETYTDWDGGVEHLREIDLPYVLSPSQAQRLAKIELERSRQGITITFPAKWTAMRISPLDNVLVSIASLGFSAKPFEVVKMDISDQNDGIDLVLRETAPEVWDWNSGEETAYDPAPNTTLPNPFTVAAPTSVAVESGTDQLLLASDGTIVVRALVTWSGYDGLSTGWAEIEAKPSAASDWAPFGRVTADAGRFYVAPLADGLEWDFRVRHINALGVRSPWATVGNHWVEGKSGAPAAPTGLSATPRTGGFVAQWTNPTDLDFERAIIHISQVDNINYAVATELPKGQDYYDTTDFGWPTMSLYLWIQAMDTSGNVSSLTGSIEVMPLKMNPNTNGPINNLLSITSPSPPDFVVGVNSDGSLLATSTRFTMSVSHDGSSASKEEGAASAGTWDFWGVPVVESGTLDSSRLPYGEIGLSDMTEYSARVVYEIIYNTGTFFIARVGQVIYARADRPRFSSDHVDETLASDAALSGGDTWDDIVSAEVDHAGGYMRITYAATLACADSSSVFKARCVISGSLVGGVGRQNIPVGEIGSISDSFLTSRSAGTITVTLQVARVETGTSSAVKAFGTDGQTHLLVDAA